MNRGKPSDDLEALLDALFGESGFHSHAEAAAGFAACPAKAAPAGTGNSAGHLARLAAYLDSGLSEEETRRFQALLASSPQDLQDFISCASHLNAITSDPISAPKDLLSRDETPPSTNVVPLHHARSRRNEPPALETFELLAAASGAGQESFRCRSQSGLWTLEPFFGATENGRDYLLLEVDPAYRAAYEGRVARIFVKTGDRDLVLAEGTIRDGEVFAEVSLTELDLRHRDAVSVAFGLPPETSA
jgi:hypothetical protein